MRFETPTLIGLLTALAAAPAHAQGSTSACRPADAISAEMLEDLKRIATGADSTSAERRSIMMIPQVNANQVAYVTDKVVCNRALPVYNAATRARDANTGREVDLPSGKLYIVKIGNVYVAWDPVKQIGDYRSYVTLSKQYQVLANTMF